MLMRAAGSVAVAECGASWHLLCCCAPVGCHAEYLVGAPQVCDRLVGPPGQPCAWEQVSHVRLDCLQARATFWLPGWGVPAAMCPGSAAEETAAALQQLPAKAIFVAIFLETDM